jgi:Flp pilus assembly pilin Flp
LLALSLPLAFGECSTTECSQRIIQRKKWGVVTRLLLSLYARLNRISDDHGATAAEYALFLATITAVIAGAVTTIGINLNTVFTNFVAAI